MNTNTEAVSNAGAVGSPKRFADISFCKSFRFHYELKILKIIYG